VDPLERGTGMLSPGPETLTNRRGLANPASYRPNSFAFVGSIIDHVLRITGTLGPSRVGGLSMDGEA
jgi:hypothetical protein